jgi:hypothetical protein
MKAALWRGLLFCIRVAIRTICDPAAEKRAFWLIGVDRATVVDDPPKTVGHRAIG